MRLSTCRWRSVAGPRSPRRVRERIENDRRRPEATSGKTPAQRADRAESPPRRYALISSGGQEVAGSNPASPTRRTPAQGGFRLISGMR